MNLGAMKNDKQIKYINIFLRIKVNTIILQQQPFADVLQNS